MKTVIFAIGKFASLLSLAFLLPATACGEQAGKSPVQVYILAGQSNMQGQGVVDLDHPQYYNGGRGILQRVMSESKTPERYKHLKDDKGRWTERDDVWVRYQTEHSLKKGPLTIGFTGYEGKHHIGPELQIGNVLGDHLDNQVLLIKTAWGGKSLYKDFRPPSAGGETGEYYTKMIAEVRQGLAHLKQDFPDYDGRGYEIAGFVWFQGWNDMFDDAAHEQYEANLVHLIHDVRKEFDRPRLPVVIGELGNGGEKAGANMQAIRAAQAAATARDEFQGTVAFVKTTAFARPAEDSPNKGHGHHWFGNAESYFLIGDALGQAMIDLNNK